MSKSVGIIGISSPLKADAVNLATENIKNFDIEPIFFGQLSKAEDQTSLFSVDNAKNRIANIAKIKDVEFVLSSRGGYSAMEILPQLKEVPNLPFVGYSDFTAFLNQAERLNFKAIHGTSFGNFTTITNEQIDSFTQLLQLIETNQITYHNLIHMYGAKEAEGYVFGGNLSVLTSLLGTPYFPKFKDKILFIEEIGERPYKIHRMLKQLEFAKVLSKVSGVVIGDCKNCTHDFPPTIEDVFKDIFGKAKYPVYGGLSAGHSKLNLPIPFYLPAKLSASLVFG